MSDDLKSGATAVAAADPVAGPPGPQSTLAAKGHSRTPSWVVTTGILLFIGHLPLLVLYSTNLMGREAYQFAPLAGAAALYLVWHRLRRCPEPIKPGEPRQALTILGGAFALLCFATVMWSPWLGMISALVTALGVVWAAGGRALAARLFPGALMLLILVRPPLNLDMEFTLVLRRIAVRCSSCLLDYLGIIHLVSGNIVEVPGHRFFVEDACSGINSVLLVGASALFYTLWRRRRWWQVALVWLAAIALVLLGNVIRITAAVTLYQRYGIDLLSGWKHEAFGLVLLAAYLGLVISADAFFDFVSARPEPENAKPAPGTASVPAAFRTRWASIKAGLAGAFSPRWAIGVGTAFALLAVAQTARGLTRSQQRVRVNSKLPAEARFSVPNHLGDWQRLDRTERNVATLQLEAIYSQVWTYQNRRLTACVALDYPYPGLHDLAVCYRNAGWDVAKTTAKTTDPAGKPEFYFELDMRRKPLMTGYVLFGGFTESGEWAGEDFNRLVQKRMSGSWTVIPIPTYQVQVLYSSYAPLSMAEKEQMLALFAAARQALVPQVLSQLKR